MLVDYEPGSADHVHDWLGIEKKPGDRSPGMVSYFILLSAWCYGIGVTVKFCVPTIVPPLSTLTDPVLNACPLAAP